ncbi:hypothetical protein [Aquihabitans sp. McL0605]|uniref:hypothetical protein n=1 Tax=Aquihabitans sp. McL0605 TaxID=3415671 RepID=UPI003CF506E6
MGCGCIVAMIGMAAPRFAIFLVWLFSDRMAIAFNGFLEAFLGFLFLPFTTLFFALVYAPVGGVSGFGWIIVGFGLVLDISSYTSGAKARADRAASI